MAGPDPEQNEQENSVETMEQDVDEVVAEGIQPPQEVVPGVGKSPDGSVAREKNLLLSQLGNGRILRNQAEVIQTLNLAKNI